MTLGLRLSHSCPVSLMSQAACAVASMKREEESGKLFLTRLGKLPMEVEDLIESFFFLNDFGQIMSRRLKPVAELLLRHRMGSVPHEALSLSALIGDAVGIESLLNAPYAEDNQNLRQRRVNSTLIISSQECHLRIFERLFSRAYPQGDPLERRSTTPR